MSQSEILPTLGVSQTLMVYSKKWNHGVHPNFGQTTLKLVWVISWMLTTHYFWFSLHWHIRPIVMIHLNVQDVLETAAKLIILFTGIPRKIVNIIHVFQKLPLRQS